MKKGLVVAVLGLLILGTAGALVYNDVSEDEFLNSVAAEMGIYSALERGKTVSATGVSVEGGAVEWQREKELYGDTQVWRRNGTIYINIYRSGSSSVGAGTVRDAAVSNDTLHVFVTRYFPPVRKADSWTRKKTYRFDSSREVEEVVIAELGYENACSGPVLNGTIRRVTGECWKVREKSVERHATIRSEPHGTPDLDPGDTVRGVVIGGEAKAYPVWVLDQERVINDRVGRIPILISEGRVFRRNISGEILEFSIEDGAMVDSAGNEWSFRGEALEGPHRGESLDRVAELEFTFTWSAWNRSHPGSAVYSD